MGVLSPEASSPGAFKVACKGPGSGDAVLVAVDAVDCDRTELGLGTLAAEAEAVRAPPKLGTTIDGVPIGLTALPPPRDTARKPPFVGESEFVGAAPIPKLPLTTSGLSSIASNLERRFVRLAAWMSLLFVLAQLAFEAAPDSNAAIRDFKLLPPPPPAGFAGDGLGDAESDIEDAGKREV